MKNLLSNKTPQATRSGDVAGGSVAWGLLGAFCFKEGIMDIGILPWWTDPNIKAEFLQLILTQTHILDYWLWPERPELMHVHSLVWFAVLILLVAWFYRRHLGPTWMAGVAVLLFAIEDGHGMPVGWICNRNTLIAACFEARRARAVGSSHRLDRRALARYRRGGPHTRK